MKLRIRFCQTLSPGPSQPHVALNVTAGTDADSPEQITLFDLKQSLYEYLVLHTGCQKQDNGWKQVVVSLDGTHPISPPGAGQGVEGGSVTRDSICQDDKLASLQSLGLVQGDTIYVMEIPCNVGSTEEEDPQPSNRSIRDQRAETNAMHCPRMLPYTLFKIDQRIKERGLVYRLTRNDALALIINGSLTDYGFDCCHQIDSLVGNACKKNPCVYEINYTLRIKNVSKHLEMLLYLSMHRKTVMLVMQFPCGSLVSKCIDIPSKVFQDQVHGVSTSDHNIWNIVLRWTDEQCFHMLTSCKDDFCRHVLLMACAKMNIEYPGACLSMMPVDVKMKILGFLSFDDVCCMGMTCREFCTLHRDNALWLALLEKYFERDTVADSNVYGKYAAKQEFKRLKLAQREDLSRTKTSAMFGLRWSPPPPAASVQPRYGFPGITGGDYDRLPPGFPHRRTSRHTQWRLD